MIAVSPNAGADAVHRGIANFAKVGPFGLFVVCCRRTAPVSPCLGAHVMFMGDNRLDGVRPPGGGIILARHPRFIGA